MGRANASAAVDGRDGFVRSRPYRDASADPPGGRELRSTERKSVRCRFGMLQSSSGCREIPLAEGVTMEYMMLIADAEDHMPKSSEEEQATYGRTSSGRRAHGRRPDRRGPRAPAFVDRNDSAYRPGWRQRHRRAVCRGQRRWSAVRDTEVPDLDAALALASLLARWARRRSRFAQSSSVTQRAVVDERLSAVLREERAATAALVRILGTGTSPRSWSRTRRCPRSTLADRRHLGQPRRMAHDRGAAQAVDRLARHARYRERMRQLTAEAADMDAPIATGGRRAPMTACGSSSPAAIRR